MDGYSVKDAAIVLGIPERRVWELLARGVLAGAPEGPDGMIVYLQPRSAPPSVTASAGPSASGSEAAGPKANGNGGSSEFSPFRELLTEFRNLTERYGQALLALGEARGEVASLRSRVDLLEARMDLRLPSSPPTPTVAWEIPEFASAEGEVAATSTFEADASLVDDTATAELEEALAGEDEPAAEPMIDLVEDAALAGEDEPAAEPMIDLVEEAVLADAVLDAIELESEVAELTEEEPLPEAFADEFAPPEAEPTIAEPEVQPVAESMAEPMAAAATLEEATEESEAPKRRTRRGRTATAAFAAALARADDPTIAELPGAEETAAALAALQRDIEASRGAEAAVETEPEPAPAEADAQPEALAMESEPDANAEQAQPESAAEPEVTESVAPAIVADEAPAPELEQPGVMAADATEPAEAPAAEAEAPAPEAEGQAPEQAAVPSYYSTDVVDPDWFADGDFSWLEAAQAEGMRIEGDRPAPAAESGSAEEQVVEEPPPAAFEDAERPDVEGHDEGDANASEGGGAGVAAELAFGEHPATDAMQPDVEHDGSAFEPSVESQALAEEEARSAIQDAFEDGPAGYDASESDAGGEVAGAVLAVAEAEPEPANEPEVEQAEPEVALEPTVEEPEAPTEPEASSDEPSANATFETPAEALTADEPMPPPHADSRADHEAEVEAEAIQEAFEETTPTPSWSPPMAAAEPGFEAAPELSDDLPRAYHASQATDEAALAYNDAQAADDMPRAYEEAEQVEAAATFRGPEEFIAPAAVAPMPTTAPTPPAADPQPRAASGEEELMWLGEEFEESDLEVAAEGWRSPSATPAAPSTPSPVLELSDTELAQLAEDEGWDRDEVEAIRRLLGRPADDPPSDLTGSEMPSAPDTSPPAITAPPVTEQRTPPENVAPASRAAEPPARSMPGSSDPSGVTADDIEDPEWLQGRSGAAADAYRRLRKLFPS